MAIGVGQLERACLTAVWLLASVSCNAITGASDLAIGDQGETDAGGVGPRVDDGGSGSDAAGQPDAFVSGPFAYHRTISLTAHGAAKGPILLVLPSSFTYAHVKANGDDMRFSTTADRSDDVPYFIETWSAGAESHVWLRPGAIPANDTLYMFYGNASAGPASAFAPVFPNAKRTAGGGAGSFAATADIDLDWFELKAGDTLTLPAGNVLKVAAARIILAGTIDGNGRGAAGGTSNMDGSGPGGGHIAPASGSASGGGGYGGGGGQGGSDTVGAGGPGGSAYGTPAGDDIAVGSGGAAASTRAGGAGGGGISIVGWSVTGNGSVHVNGGDGQGLAGQNAGGGSGGGILLDAMRLELGGATLTANGGAGGPCANSGNDGGGGGGGGRIKLRHGAVYAAPATMTAAFGLGATQAATTAPGANGTIGTTDVSASASLVTGYDAALGAEAP